jgi:ligand-binding SRPBCC domain-containing protein
MVHHLHREQLVRGDPRRVWEFFATPRNLDALTPPNVRFQIIGGLPPKMFAGQFIEYRIGILPGISTRWLTEITDVREGELFVDEQRAGPYRLWRHEHRFAPAPGGVHMIDHVAYEVGWGLAGWLAERIWIRRQLAMIFDYRRDKISALFP